MKKCRTYLFAVEHRVCATMCTEYEEFVIQAARELLNDNGDLPDGDLLPIEPVAPARAKEIMRDEFELSRVVDAMYFDSSRELLEFAHGEDVDLASLDQDEIEAQAWSVAQNLGRYATRYSASDIIIVANDLPVA